MGAEMLSENRVVRFADLPMLCRERLLGGGGGRIKNIYHKLDILGK